MANLVNQICSINFYAFGAVETMEKFTDNLDVQKKMMDDVLDYINAGIVTDREINELF